MKGGGGKSRRVCFVIPLGHHFPSGVRRVLDYLPHLAEAGWESTVLDWSSPSLYRLSQALSARKRRLADDWRRRGFRPSHAVALLASPLLLPAALLAKGWAAAGERVHRARVTAAVRAAARRGEVVFFQQVTPPAELSRRLAREGCRVVFDIDDAVFLNRPRETEAVLRAAAVAVPGSHYNAEYCARFCRKVVFLPTPVPLSDFSGRTAGRAPRAADAPMTVGWIGSPSTARYLDLLPGPLDRLGSRYPGRVRLLLVGIGNRVDLVPSFRNVEVEVVPWVPPAEVPGLVARLDAGVMPLHDTEWEKGKCGLKALEYMAAAVPAVCSDVGENRHIVADGKNGFLAADEAEWEDRLERLLLDPALARRLGEAGQATVRERYDTAACAAVLLRDVLEPLCG